MSTTETKEERHKRQNRERVARYREKHRVSAPESEPAPNYIEQILEQPDKPEPHKPKNPDNIPRCPYCGHLELFCACAKEPEPDED